MEKIAFCVITFDQIKIQTHSAPQNDRLNFSFVKDIHVDGGNLAWNSCKTAICLYTFFYSPSIRQSTSFLSLFKFFPSSSICNSLAFFFFQLIIKDYFGYLDLSTIAALS